MRRTWLLAAALATASANAGAGEPLFDSGLSLTAGSRSYHRLSLFGDFEGQGSLRPYAWAEYATDNYLNIFSLGGGVWKDFSRDLRAKAGLGFDVGHVKDTQGTDSAFVFETGLEKDVSGPTLGAQYKVTAGTIGGSTGPSGSGHNLPMHSGAVGMGGMGGGGGGQVEVQSYAYHEVSGYARFPIGKSRLMLKTTLGLPSYASSIKDESLGFRFPAASSLWVTTSLTAEQQSGDSRVYFSAGLYYLF